MKYDYTPSEIAEALASISNSSSDDTISNTQVQYLSHMEDWFSLGWRDGVEYGFQNNIFRKFYELEFDEDCERLIPLPSEVGEIQLSGMSCSLHRLIEVSPSSNTQPVEQTENAPRCEKVLSRCFEVGRLMTKGKDAPAGTLTRFLVVKALGPPDCVGFWIIGLPPSPENSHTDPEDDDPGDEPMTDIKLAQLRRDRICLLDGFPEPFSYARIKEDGQPNEFDLVDPVAESFVLSHNCWLEG